MKYIKVVFVLYLFVLFFSQKSFSYFEDRVYCNITKDKIIVSLDVKNTYTCKVYTRYIEVQMKKVYNDILLIQKYVDKKQDLGYWNPLKEEKVVLLNRLQAIRLNILAHMKTFEVNLFETSKSYFLDSISDYYKKLSRSLDLLVSLEDPSGDRYLVLIKEQLSIIENIGVSKTFEELNSSIKRYVYLKQQILGK